MTGLALAGEAPLLLAHSPVLTALPFVVPAVAVVTVVGAVVVCDRWRARAEPEEQDRA